MIDYDVVGQFWLAVVHSDACFSGMAGDNGSLYNNLALAFFAWNKARRSTVPYIARGLGVPSILLITGPTLMIYYAIVERFHRGFFHHASLR